MYTESLVQEYAEFARMSQSSDPVEKALGTVYLALVPEFSRAISALNGHVPSNQIVAASMQALAHIVSGLMIAAHDESPQTLYNMWHPSFDKLVHANLALYASGQDGMLPASLKALIRQKNVE